MEYPIRSSRVNLFIFEDSDSTPALTAINLFSEILPSAISEWHDSIQSADILFPYSFTKKYPLKIARVDAKNYLDTTIPRYGWENAIIVHTLSHSNLQQNIKHMMSRHGYEFNYFSAEKVALNVKKLRESLNGSRQDSIEFPEKPFIGMLWTSFSKKQ